MIKCGDDNVDKKSIIPRSLVAGLNVIDCGGGENDEIPLGLLPVCLSAVSLSAVSLSAIHLSAEAKKRKVR